MPLIWTEDMGRVGRTPELEAVTRAAVIAGTEFLGAIPDGAEQPRFNGSRFLVPKNAAARAFVTEVSKMIPAGVIGVARETIIATALSAATYVNAHGKGDAGWTALKQKLELQRQARRQSPPPSP